MKIIFISTRNIRSKAFLRTALKSGGGVFATPIPDADWSEKI